MGEQKIYKVIRGNSFNNAVSLESEIQRPGPEGGNAVPGDKHYA
jgi:hypothetical protein